MAATECKLPLKLLPIQTKLFDRLVQDVDNVEACEKRFPLLLAISDDQYFQNLQANALAPIEAEVERLSGDRVTWWKKSGAGKADQMLVAKRRIDNALYNGLAEIEGKRVVNEQPNLNESASNHAREFNAFKVRTHQLLKREVNDLANNPYIGKHRNLIGAFFKGILGVILVLGFTAGIAFASSRVRTYIFGSKTQAVCNRINEVIENSEPIQSQAPAPVL